MKFYSFSYSETIPAYHNLPADYKYSNGHKLFYKAYGGATYRNAVKICNKDGAYLARPRSYNENYFLIGLHPNSNIWIGINDIDREGYFKSVDSYPVYYTRWNSGEPNSQGDEDGVHIEGHTGRWNDRNTGYNYKFVCFRRMNTL